MNKKLYLFLATAAAWLNAPPFQNLGFDQANTNKIISENPIIGTVSDAFLTE
jgi:hypothetical protein